MNNTDQIRLILEEIFAVADCVHEPDETHGLARIEKLAKQALALLPCKTCNDTGYTLCPGCVDRTKKHISTKPCPDCK